MSFEQDIAAIEALTQSLRNREQASLIMTDEVAKLREENADMRARIQELMSERERVWTDREKVQDKYEVEVRRNGELAATLKSFLGQIVHLATDATEALRVLEDKPEIPPAPPKAATPKGGWAEKKQKSAGMLEKCLQRDHKDMLTVPIGHNFILDPPLPTDLPTEYIKKWYSIQAGKVPSNWPEGPGVEFRREHNGKIFVRFTVPKWVEEGRDERPFRTPEREGTESEIQSSAGERGILTTKQDITQTAFPPDDGQTVPEFLKKGNGSTHDDQRGQS
jgi:hypothetical protein